MINIPTIVEIIEEAGRRIIATKSEELGVAYKGDGSECTNADLISNSIIIHHLRETYPDIPVISEESLPATGIDNLKQCDYIWFLDPLDGTKDFIQGGDNYSINLALLFKGEPIFGIISLPEKNITYYNDGHKLFVRKPGGQAQQITPNHQETSKLRVVISRRSDPEVIKKFLKKGTEYELTVQQGALKYCYLASGQFDIFPRYKETCEWDVAAGHALLKATGGALVTSDCQELTYFKKDFLNHELIAVRDPKYLKFLVR